MPLFYFLLSFSFFPLPLLSFSSLFFLFPSSSSLSLFPLSLSIPLSLYSPLSSPSFSSPSSLSLFSPSPSHFLFPLLLTNVILVRYRFTTQTKNGSKKFQKHANILWSTNDLLLQNQYLFSPALICMNLDTCAERHVVSGSELTESD